MKISLVVNIVVLSTILSPAEAIYHIDINESPSKGSCEATVYEGIALVDQFSFFCYGWEDVHVPLVYTFKARVVGTSTTQIFHSGR